MTSAPSLAPGDRSSIESKEILGRKNSNLREEGCRHGSHKNLNHQPPLGSLFGKIVNERTNSGENTTYIRPFACSLVSSWQRPPDGLRQATRGSDMALFVDDRLWLARSVGEGNWGSWPRRGSWIERSIGCDSRHGQLNVILNAQSNLIHQRSRSFGMNRYALFK